jgi:5'-3' exonuclease
MAGKSSRPLTVLVDTSSLAYRAYFAVPDTVRAPDGTPVNAAYGFLSMLARLVAELRPRFLACALDSDWRPQWRVDLIESYKTHRLATAEDQADESIEAQIDLIARLLDMAGIAVLGADGYEAEDVIGSLVRRARGPVAIVSGDRDLFQLVGDPHVWVLYPRRGVSDLVRVDEAEIERRYAIPGRLYADFAILRGDPSDGLPGVPGVGEKTAAALILAHGSLEGVVKAAAGRRSGPLAKVASSLDYIRRAEQVVRITGDAPIDRPAIGLPLRPPHRRFRSEARRLALDGPVERLLAALGAGR